MFIFVLSLLILFVNLISFHIYNVEIIDSKLTNRERRNKKENVFSKLFFIKYFRLSNKFLWVCNLINITISFLGTVWVIVNLFLKNDDIDNLVGGILMLTLLFETIFMLISKLLIHINRQKSWLGKVFLIVYLAVLIIGIIGLLI